MVEAVRATILKLLVGAAIFGHKSAFHIPVNHHFDSCTSMEARTAQMIFLLATTAATFLAFGLVVLDTFLTLVDLHYFV